MSIDYKKILKLSTAVIFSCTIICASSTSFSQSLEDTHKDANEIARELNKKEDVSKKLTLKAKSLNSELKSLKKDMISLSRDLQNRETDLMDTERELKSLKAKKKEYIESIYLEHQSMGGVVSAARKFSRNPAISIIAQDSPIDAARSLTIIKSIIPSINKKSAYLKQQLAELEDVEDKISRKLATQKVQKNHLNVEMQELSTMVAKRRTLYEKTQHESEEYIKEVAKLREESKNIEELMQNLKTKIKPRPKDIAISDFDRNISDNNFMPVSGELYIKFGEKDDMGAESKGITFVTLAGARVVTPLAGVVKFAGPFQNHKTLLIIEHPNGYYSLISGLERIDTIVGASLAAGEPVGVTDENLLAPRIYYELRQGGEPINPQKVLIAQVKRGKG